MLSFLRELPKTERIQAGRTLDLLEWQGTALRMPFSRSITSQDSLFELRINGENNIYRIFYFHFTGKKFVLLHAFIKKTQKTPDKEIKIAVTRLKDYKNQQPQEKR